MTLLRRVGTGLIFPGLSLPLATPDVIRHSGLDCLVRTGLPLTVETTSLLLHRRNVGMAPFFRVGFGLAFPSFIARLSQNHSPIPVVTSIWMFFTLSRFQLARSAQGARMRFEGSGLV